MGFYVGKQTVKRILDEGKNILDAKVLLMGMTFKEDVSDIRNSKVIDVIRELESFSVHVDVIDPHAKPEDVKRQYDLELTAEAETNAYDAIIVAVNHAEYKLLTEDDFKVYLKGGEGVLTDIRGMYKGKIKDLTYWSL